MLNSNTFPRLVSDIGGTNARFAIESAPLQFNEIKTMSCQDYPSLAAAINTYLTMTNKLSIKHAALAVPSPIIDDTLFMVNSPWHLASIAQTQKETQLESLIFLNDWHAMALAIPHLPAATLIQHGGLEADRQKPITVIGPGTGLGMATLIKHPKTNDYFAIPAEGGRSSFVATTEEEVELWRFAHKRFQHVSIERFLSGPGLQLIYEAVCHMHNITAEYLLKPSEITSRALKQQCPICQLCLEHFCRILGTMAANLACITNSFGGIYIGGGIIPKICDYFIASDFRQRFEDKGRYRSYLEKMPVYIITHEYPAMLGCSYALETYLQQNYLP